MDLFERCGNNEDELLKNAYSNSLKLAKENDIKTIVFPAISTGVYAFPLERAADIAINEVLSFLSNNNTIEKVIFAQFSDKAYKVYEDKLKEIDLD